MNERSLDELEMEAEAWLMELYDEFELAWEGGRHEDGSLLWNEQPDDEPEDGGGEVQEPLEEEEELYG